MVCVLAGEQQQRHLREFNVFSVRHDSYQKLQMSLEDIYHTRPAKHYTISIKFLWDIGEITYRDMLRI